MPAAESITPSTLDLPVAACPGWSLEDLVVHTGRVHRFVTGKLRDPGFAIERSVDIEDRPETRDATAGWFEAGAADLLAALDAADPEAVTTSWAGPQPPRFWLRRMLQETTVHAWDAEATVGEPAVVSVAVALDGIDEVLDVIFPRRFDVAGFLGSGAEASGATIHLHATDEGLPEGAGEWLLTVRPGGLEVVRDHAKGDVAVRGPAAALYLLVWSRIPAGADELTVFGDAAVLDRLAAATDF